MEAADDAASGVAPLGGLIVGGEDDFAGAAGGTKQGGFWKVEEVKVTEGG